MKFEFISQNVGQYPLNELCEALEFLSAGAAHQMANIPDCPACETWTEMGRPTTTLWRMKPLPGYAVKKRRSFRLPADVSRQYVWWYRS